MFDHRLGLALHKSVGEIHQIPFPEYKIWYLMYLLEPWGWEEREYALASMLAQAYNMKRGKKKAKTPKDFMRDMEKEILKQLRETDFDAMTEDELNKKKIAAAKKAFGMK